MWLFCLESLPSPGGELDRAGMHGLTRGLRCACRELGRLKAVTRRSQSRRASGTVREPDNTSLYRSPTWMAGRPHSSGGRLRGDGTAHSSGGRPQRRGTARLKQPLFPPLGGTRTARRRTRWWTGRIFSPHPLGGRQDTSASSYQPSGRPTAIPAGRRTRGSSSKVQDLLQAHA